MARSGPHRHDRPVDLVIFAMGFAHPEHDGVVQELGRGFDSRENIVRNDDYETNVSGVFACSDAGRGQSVVVWAIAEGRAVANGFDAYLKGSPSVLPKPVKPSDRQMMVRARQDEALWVRQGTPSGRRLLG